MSDDGYETNAYRGMPFDPRALNWEVNHELDARTVVELATNLASNAINGHIGWPTMIRRQAIEGFLSRLLRTSSSTEPRTYSVAFAHQLAKDAIEWWGSEECRKSVAFWASVD